MGRPLSNEQIRAVFAERLNRKLLQRGKKELRETLGITPQAMSRYARGELLPTVDHLISIAAFLGTTVDYLVNKTNDEYGED